MFVLQNMPRTPLHLPGLTIAEEYFESFSAKYDLTMSLDETPTGLHGMLEYATDLFDAAIAGQIVDQYLHSLQAIVESPDDRLLDARLEISSAPSDDFSFQDSCTP
jgi:non-ribosomal peptide synthetase component F